MTCHKVTWTLVISAALLRFCSSAALTRNTVDPPIDLRIVDPGHLGQLQISWKLPAGLQNLTDCFVRFQLAYLNTYDNRWRTVMTTQTNYSAQFDLNKDARVTVHTLVSGPCVNSVSELRSPPAKALLQAQRNGLPASKVHDLKCVFHNWEYMVCTWNKAEVISRSQYHLYYWHKVMEQVEECPDYLQQDTSDGGRIGCRFQRHLLMEFTDFNICVNGSAVQPAYFTLQIQEHVEPDPVKFVSLQSLSGREFRLWWEAPAGPVPEHCLEYQVKSVPAGAEGHTSIITQDLYLNISRPQHCKKCCLKVRCRVHLFCADRGFWSGWSHPLCFADPDFSHSLDRGRHADDSSNVLPSEVSGRG